MTNKIRRVTCVILALVLLLSANAYAVDDLGESTFTGTIIVDSESPKLLNLGEIEIEVYQSTPIETDESYTIYSEEYAFSVYPDENGISQFIMTTPSLRQLHRILSIIYLHSEISRQV